MLRLWYFTTCAMVFCSACNIESQKPEDLLASAYGNKLYKSDLGELITSEMTVHDSSSILKKHVDKWLLQEILFHEAKAQVGTEDRIEQLVENYKKSLYIHELEKTQLAAQLDTLITRAELDTFYNQRKEDFLLDEEIVRLLFVKVPEAYDNENLKTLWKTENLPALSVFIKEVGGLQFLNLENWYYLSEMRNLIPAELLAKVNFSKTEAYSLSQDGYRFLIKILDHTDNNEIAPKSFALEKIKLRLLHDRSSGLLKKWKKDLYQNNIQSKNITINY